MSPTKEGKGIVASLLAIAVAILVVAARVAVHWRLEGTAGLSPWKVLVLLALAAVFFHAIRKLAGTWHDRPAGRERAGGQLALLWCGLVLLAILLWPWGSDPGRYSLATWAWLVALLGFPLSLVNDRPEIEPLRGRVTLYLRTIIAVAVVCAVISAVSYLQAVRRDIGSVDFFYYLCCARDMLTRPETVSEMCYIYFPGVYAFWRAMMRTVGTELASLQNAYLTVLALNALLIGAIVLRVARAPLGALVASLWFLVIISRFEGLAGVTEPLATVPFLLGLLIWAGRPLRGWRSCATAVLFGATLGLTVYTKQQGGLLSLGFLALLATRPLVPEDSRHGWVELALIPFTALAVLLAGLLLEGRGWLPLKMGAAWVRDYQAEGSWLSNLYTQVRADESAALLALVAIVMWVVMLSGGKRRYWVQREAFQIVSFVIIAGLATLIQFRSRPYGHYMLLAVPCVVLAVSLLYVLVLPGLLDRFDRRPLARFVMLAAAAIPFFSTAGRTDTLYVWRVFATPADVARPQWHTQASVSADLVKLKEVIPARTVMFHFPPRHNSLYYLLDTYSASPFGYVYFTPQLDQIAWDQCEHVLCLRAALDETDLDYWAASGGVPRVTALLDEKGFRRADDVPLETMELFQRR